jgi:hypothetical protein
LPEFDRLSPETVVAQHPDFLIRGDGFIHIGHDEFNITLGFISQEFL